MLADDIFETIRAYKLPVQQEKLLFEQILETVIYELDENIRDDFNHTEEHKKVQTSIKNLRIAKKLSESLTPEDYDFYHS